MFRHFFCDPNPARIMRNTAPAMHEWVVRMWNIKPQRFAKAAQISALSDDLQPLLRPVIAAYLPYLQANESAVIKQRTDVHCHVLNTDFTEPVKPYRLWCLDQLRRQFQALENQAQQNVSSLLGDSAITVLSATASGLSDQLIPELPITPTDPDRKVSDSWGRTIS